MTRRPLSNRRSHVVRTLEHGTTRCHIGFGFDESGIAREVFADAKRCGTDVQAMLSDACILMSLCAQHGMTFLEIASALHENRPEGASSGPPASIIGQIARMGAGEAG